jgi:hypothetical protein
LALAESIGDSMAKQLLRAFAEYLDAQADEIERQKNL